MQLVDGTLCLGLDIHEYSALDFWRGGNNNGVSREKGAAEFAIVQVRIVPSDHESSWSKQQ